MIVTVNHISSFFEKWAPQSTKLDFDNVGLLVGDPNASISGIITCLDVTDAVVEEAISAGANLITAHHPPIFRKISRINPITEQGRLLYKLIKHDIGVFVAHTNLDMAFEGVSFALAEMLGLRNLGFLKGEVSKVTGETIGLGAVGAVENPEGMPVDGFLAMVARNMGLSNFRYSGSADRIKQVAVCGGTGASLVSEVQRQDIQAYITADVKYHEYFVEKDNLLLVDIGHYESEIPIVEVLRERIAQEFTSLKVASTRVNTNPMRYFSTSHHGEHIQTQNPKSTNVQA